MQHQLCSDSQVTCQTGHHAISDAVTQDANPTTGDNEETSAAH